MRPDCCAGWVPNRYKEWVPRKVDLPDGGEGFVIKNSKPIVGQQGLFAGHPVEEFTPYGTPWTGPGTGAPKQRLQEQDTDGVDAEVLYPAPQFLRLCRTAIKDPDAYEALLRAYNDWLAQEYCAEAPDRLLGVGVLPVSNIDAMIAELEHCKKLGLPAVNLAAFPAGHRYRLLTTIGSGRRRWKCRCRSPYTFRCRRKTTPMSRFLSILKRRRPRSGQRPILPNAVIAMAFAGLRMRFK